MNPLYISAPFDPISQKELEAILQIRRQNPSRRVVLWCETAGHAAYRTRVNWLKYAVKPYRKLTVSDLPITEKDGMIRLDDALIDSERTVRQGAFRKAAKGIRRELAESMEYLEAIVDAHCKPNRAAHSRSVAACAKMLAECHGVDPLLAEKAGYLHDLTKAWSEEEGRAILEVYAPEIIPLAPAVYHSYTCPVYLQTVMGIQDRALLDAVREHTLGTCRSDLSKILYIADKIEPTRGYDVSKETALAKRDLDAAFRLVVLEGEQYRERKANG